MVKKTISEGTIHKVPEDLKEYLIRDEKILEKWNSLTPLARNEWICWVTIVRKEETRKQHLSRLNQDLVKGKRRPCCWPGCPHHREKAKKWFKNKK